ncbi:precorrin-6y C5,15-methyltransferase (decarboxylating) subunit CbiE [Prolixibacteraceae bacterium JC049]|nr:precorrin-6y C5,15-methyltransferase (decarboxylating) subunit CbiE [Prolixibacteraceae bacterium JC049]
MTQVKRHITICGIGPGNPDYILPIVWKKAGKAQLLVGGSRHLEIFRELNKETISISGKLVELKNEIEQSAHKEIVAVVSGDTGFYSLRNYLSKQFPDAQIDVVPGISSFQYFYAQINCGYEKAFISSLHGIENDFISKLNDYESIFLLTDKHNNWKTIAQQLIDNGYGHLKMFVGNRLSYEDEQIIEKTANELILDNYQFDLCAVIIKTESNEG